MTNINWESSLIDSQNNMKDAIKNLEDSMNRISIVVDEEQRLVGTITDGDIRRAILSGLSMNAEVNKFMNSKPTYIYSNMPKDSVISLMREKDIFQTPIIDNERKVVGLETLHNLLEIKQIDNPVFLMAGGFGKRLAPLTNETPKPLLKIGSKPILERILNKFIEVGFYDFYISTHFQAEKIKNYFKDGSDWNINISYVHEDKPLGTGGALGLLPKDKISHPVIIMNGDLISEINFVELLDYHQKHNSKATMCVSEYQLEIPYGVVNQLDHKLINIDEKPKQKFFINAGIYVVEPSVIDQISENTVIDMTTVLDNLIESGEEVNVFPIHEYWLDVGQHVDFNKAVRDIEDET